MRTERKVMMAASKSKPECRASESTPRLPVRTTRKAFSETKSVAEPTLRSAARFFSRASSIGATISIEGLDYPRFRIPSSAGEHQESHGLFRRGHGGWRQQRQPVGFGARATYLPFV